MSYRPSTYSELEPFVPILSEEERVRYLAGLRKQLEFQVHEAEILFSLVRKHLDAAQMIEKEIEAFMESRKRCLFKITPEMDAQIIEMWNAGERSCKRIGFKLKLHAKTVQRRLEGLGAIGQ